MSGADPPTSTAVLDASVAVRWVVRERGSEEAAALLDEALAWIAPRLMLVETASALRRKVTGKELRVSLATQAIGALGQAVADGTVRLVDDEDLVSAALTLALDLGHTVPDCLYLALAEREGAPLITADRRLGDLARARGVPTRVLPSA
ncbi:MAG: type II toxin-antitoxin system VapC family toxin [Candidatus Rokuibacteriota bacterium]